MKRSIKLAVVAALALGATSAFATNGTSLIGYGAKSRAMGGTGVSNFQGAESGFNNPALISNIEGTQVSIGGTYFAPDVTFESKSPAVPVAPGSHSSDASASMIPAVSMATKVNDNFSWGLALYGVGGMGVDYRNDAGMGGAAAANDNLLLMRFSVPFAYNISGFSIGLSPVIEYGALSMGTGVTTDIAYGFEVGAVYDFKAIGVEGLSFGLDYKSAVTHDFENTFNSNIDPTTGALTTPAQSKLDTPSILVAGVSYTFSGNTIALDYKNIGYGSAEGLQDFGWDNQGVVAVGYEYATEGWAARLGYNYGASPVNDNVTDPESFAGAAGSLTQFPGVTESHYTLGGTYNFSKASSIDVAYVYATGAQSIDIPAGFGGGSIEATNDQNSLTVAYNMNF